DVLIEVALITSKLHPPLWVPVDEVVLDAFLGLLAQKFNNSSQDNKESVTDVCRFRDHTRVVGCLATLDVSDDESSSLDQTRSWRLKQGEYFARRRVNGIDVFLGP